MGAINTSILACLGMAMVVTALSGCNKHRDDNYYETTQDSANSSAQTPQYVIEVDKTKGIKYAVLQHGSVITSNINGWQGLSPELFSKLSGIQTYAPEEDKTFHNVREYLHPKIESSEAHPERKMTTLSANYMVPKELNGWVAVDQETFEKLTKEFMTKP